MTTPDIAAAAKVMGELLPGEDIRIHWVPGDLASWCHEPRGGYGYLHLIDVVVRKVGAKRIQIETPLSDGRGTKLVWVSPIRLSRRKEPDHAR